MHFQQTELGDYLIYAGAVEAASGSGYTAALIVNRRGEGNARLREAYRDDALGCGYRWPSPEQAISYALARAREMIRKGSTALRC